MPTRRAVCLGLGALSLTSGCAVEMRAPAAEIALARHVPSDPPHVALLTMVSHRRERGAHTGLLINASERVIFDPAGTFRHPDMPERGDIHYGATDRLVDYYKRYHARFSHYVHAQTVFTAPDTAEMVLRRTQENGPVGNAFCTRATSAILQPVPGFNDVPITFFPEILRQAFAAIPGVADSYTVETEDLRKALPTD